MPKRKRWQKLGLGLCLLGVLAFATPLAGGILGLANGSAMAGFLLLAAAIWWWEPFSKLLARLWKRPLGKLLLLVSGLGILAAVGTLLVLSILVTTKLRAVPETEGGTLVVLGCQVKGDRPSLLLSYRIEAAADYLLSHPETKAIVSGGRGKGEDVSEARCMFEELTKRGVEPERLFLEEESSVTRENLSFSRQLMEREGLPGPAIIVSNDFHIYRALKMAEDMDFPAEGLAAGSNWYSRPTYILREAMALVKYYLTR